MWQVAHEQSPPQIAVTPYSYSRSVSMSLSPGRPSTSWTLPSRSVTTIFAIAHTRRTLVRKLRIIAAQEAACTSSQRRREPLGAAADDPRLETGVRRRERRAVPRPLYV